MLEYSGLALIQTERCDHLRCKGMYVDAIWDPSVPHAGDRLFWCHQTQQCVGPDGKVADDEVCTAERACYKTL